MQCHWPIGFLPILVLVGCGGRGEISGVITFKGKNLDTGTIVFFDERQGTESSPIKEDGSYHVKNVSTGMAKIAILMPLQISFSGFGSEAPPPPPKHPPLPAKYADPELSGLTFQVRSGPQTHDFPLD